MIRDGYESARDMREATEDPDADGHVSSAVVGLSRGAPFDFPYIYLDTVEGTVYWYNCPDAVRYDPELPCIPALRASWEWDAEGENYDGEQDYWRGQSTFWSIPDFFEVLKHQFRRLYDFPLNQVHGGSALNLREQEKEEARAIYRAHAWPDLAVYKKEECMEALTRWAEETI
ncbi:unnamed protein product [Zymoseptoria tritici ST99CH_3D1]|nr:unnamed protein product [Zymoseptoria tritici ST99CH_3D1]